MINNIKMYEQVVFIDTNKFFKDEDYDTNLAITLAEYILIDIRKNKIDFIYTNEYCSIDGQFFSILETLHDYYKVIDYFQKIWAEFSAKIYPEIPQYKFNEDNSCTTTSYIEIDYSILNKYIDFLEYKNINMEEIEEYIDENIFRYLCETSEEYSWWIKNEDSIIVPIIDYNNFTYDFMAIVNTFTTYKFLSLLKEWKDETGFLSSIHKMKEHVAFKEIVSMGPKIIPLILNKLQSNEGGFIFEALKEITGENPIKKEHRGYVIKMQQDWINWGIEKGYIK